MKARVLSCAALSILFCISLQAKDRRKPEGLQQYLQRVGGMAAIPRSEGLPGSLWIGTCLACDLAADYKAHKVGDLVTVNVSEQMLSQTSSSVQTQRKLEAESGISAIAGRINTAGVENLFSPHSTQSLQGKGQAAAKSILQTSITGRIVAVLPDDNLVIQAERHLSVNHENQRVVLRAIARPADLSPQNSVPSVALSNLEIEIEGKGVVSDGTRPPNFAIRWLLRILGL